MQCASAKVTLLMRTIVNCFYRLCKLIENVWFYAKYYEKDVFSKSYQQEQEICFAQLSSKILSSSLVFHSAKMSLVSPYLYH